MAGELAQGVGALVVDRGVVIDVAEGVFPSLVGVLGGGPEVPREVGVHEEALLGRLGLLHGVQNDAGDVAGLDVGAQEVVVAAHVQGVLVVVGARPVDPHERGLAAGVVLEVGEEGVLDLAPDAAAGVADLDVLGQLGVPGLALAVVVDRDKDDGVHEAGVQQVAVRVGLGLHLVDPVGHVLEELDVEVVALVGGIVSENGDLADAVVDDLLELLLEDGERLTVVGARDGVVHEGVKRVEVAALGGVAGLGERLDEGLELLLGVELTPVGVVLGVVLGSVEVAVELVVAAPGHELGAVLVAPGVAVVALDEATSGNVGVVGADKSTELGAVELLEDLIERGEAIERRVGVLAEHDDLIGTALSRDGGEHVGVDLLEEALGVGELALGDELLDVLVDSAAGALDAHEEARGAGGRGNLLNVVGRHALEVERLLKAVDGVLVDVLLHDDVRGAAKRLLGGAVLNGVRRGVDLVLSGRRCASRDCDGGNHQSKRTGEQSDQASHFAFQDTPSIVTIDRDTLGHTGFPQVVKAASGRVVGVGARAVFAGIGLAVPGRHAPPPLPCTKRGLMHERSEGRGGCASYVCR